MTDPQPPGQPRSPSQIAAANRAQESPRADHSPRSPSQIAADNRLMASQTEPGQGHAMEMAEGKSEDTTWRDRLKEKDEKPGGGGKSLPVPLERGRVLPDEQRENDLGRDR